MKLVLKCTITVRNAWEFLPHVRRPIIHQTHWRSVCMKTLSVIKKAEQAVAIVFEFHTIWSWFFLCSPNLLFNQRYTKCKIQFDMKKTTHKSQSRLDSFRSLAESPAIRYRTFYILESYIYSFTAFSTIFDSPRTWLVLVISVLPSSNPSSCVWIKSIDNSGEPHQSGDAGRSGEAWKRWRLWKFLWRLLKHWPVLYRFPRMPLLVQSQPPRKHMISNKFVIGPVRFDTELTRSRIWCLIQAIKSSCTSVSRLFQVFIIRVKFF